MNDMEYAMYLDKVHEDLQDQIDRAGHVIVCLDGYQSATFCFVDHAIAFGETQAVAYFVEIYYRDMLVWAWDDADPSQDGPVKHDQFDYLNLPMS